MLNVMRRVALVGGALLLLAVGAWPAWGDTPTPAPDGPTPGAAMSLGGNLLVNPNFEDGFSQREDGAVNVALGWKPWYVMDARNEYARRPEWSREFLGLPSIRVLHGDFGQKVFNSWAVHDAGIYQTVTDVPIGATLEFSVWVQVWSSECDNICISPADGAQGCRGLTNGDYAVMIGIDPQGRAPTARGVALPDGIVWSEARTDAYDRWVQLTVRAIAQSDTVTVYTRSKPRIAVKHNDSYWDTADLRVIGSPTDAWPPTVAPRPAVPLPPPTVGPAPGPTPTVVPPTPAPDTPAKGCWEGIPDGGFESAGDWRVGPGGMVEVSTVRAKEGQSALRLGGPAPATGMLAEAWHDVTIPADVNRAMLRFWVRRSADGPDSPAPIAAGQPLSRQSVAVEMGDGSPIAYALRPARVNDGDWQRVEMDLTSYRGQTLRVRFQVTGTPGDTLRMEVDGVSVEMCRPNNARDRAKQAATILPRVNDGQQGGRGVRLGWLRASQTQPGTNPFPDECNATAFEFVELENFGPPVNLDGWTLSDAAGNSYTLPYVTLAPGYRVRVWTGAGPDFVGPTIADFHAGLDSEMWSDHGDTVTLRDPYGNVITQYRYAWDR